MKYDETVKEIFVEISDRMLKALMFHKDTADLFAFMNLKGFKQLHRYQYWSENKGFIKFNSYFLDNYGRLLDNSHVDAQVVVPPIWFDRVQDDVTPEVRKQYTEKAFADYVVWETDTLAMLEKKQSLLYHSGNVASADVVSELVAEVADELKYLLRLNARLKAIEFDCVAIDDMQQAMHDEYKKKIKKL